ncbi:hypothetical protein PF006_g8868 [Phytophthora fragariae]|uniref:Uncharacterized protein n=1 Tax=Phytophthora fragariae TaxID=53985 RepID=A0A6A3U881_9STRA|nr:hypothetical protein PF003_g23758 [Phytophthora fragariae]KAE9146368.1 hypothetical protein PF006_g8868 [Phytophthora fragariae]KAE9345659.1 hypothetical protein PF008_g8643 [Phytophthora fragariae]
MHWGALRFGRLVFPPFGAATSLGGADCDPAGCSFGFDTAEDVESISSKVFAF